MARDFIKNPEDFVCENCGLEVCGDGYTNHCPECLYSKHVDINPGDRAAKCGGLMAPSSYETREGAIDLIHRCVICGYEKRNKMASGDNLARLAEL